jgi:hypothetical protein
MLATYKNAEILLYKNRLKGSTQTVKASLSTRAENVQEGDKEYNISKDLYGNEMKQFEGKKNGCTHVEYEAEKPVKERKHQ